VTEHHEAIDELLAGYVLRGLSGPDAEEADRLLTEHAPGCATCRATLDAFGAVAADLALEAPSVRPPETLLPRLHREIESRRGAERRWSSRRLIAVAASVVLVVGIGGAAMTQLGGSNTVAQADLQNVVNMLTSGGHATDLGQGHAQEITAPGVRELYIYGDDVPMPPSGSVYRLWAVSRVGAEYLGEFVPGPDGLVVLRVDIDPATFEKLLVTVEPRGSQATTPGNAAWQAAS
jgi:anti-sigma-K factor RskA